MINYVYQLVSPKVFSIKYTDISLNSDRVIIRPNYMALCHADQRYFLGQRDIKVLNKKLPMALIHECCGIVEYDPTGTFEKGQKVVMIPNTPIRKNPVIFENYDKGSYFLSSGHDGFMREFVDLPADRVVPYENVPDEVAAITEFISVGVHASTRFDLAAHEVRDSIGIWGDGSLAYSVANILKLRFPNSKLYVIGMDSRKLTHFSFVVGAYFSNNIPEDFHVDHAFECCGGEGSFYAIDDIIKYINPQGTVMLMGVSENKVAINTRDVLEKGLTFIGSSRSGRADFEKAVELMETKDFQKRIKIIISRDEPVKSIKDIIRVFGNDLTTPFKTVFKWDV